MLTRVGSIGSYALPLFATVRNRHMAGATIFALGFGIYLWTNHVHLSPPQELQFTWVDSVIPFLPTTVWIYNTEFLFFLSVYFLVSRDLDTLSKYCYAFLAILFVALVTFTFWPTTFPRDLFPLPTDLDAATAFLFNTLRNADTPANCCPSLHVSGVFLSSLVLQAKKRSTFIAMFVWGMLISLSTLTTKQHYMVDVLAGFALGGLSYWLFFRVVPYRRT